MLVCLTMIGQDGRQLCLLIEELHESKPVLFSNLLTTAQHISYRLCGILSHIPCKGLCLILETGH